MPKELVFVEQRQFVRTRWEPVRRSATWLLQANVVYTFQESCYNSPTDHYYRGLKHIPFRLTNLDLLRLYLILSWNVFPELFFKR